MSKGSKRRPVGVGVSDIQKKIIILNTEIFWEKDPVQKEELKARRKALEESINGQE